MKDNKQLEIILENILISDPYFYDENIVTDFIKNKVFDKIKSYIDKNKDEITKLNTELKSEKSLGTSKKGQEAINKAIDKNWNSLTGDSLQISQSKISTLKGKSFAEVMINIYDNLIKSQQRKNLKFDPKSPEFSSFDLNEINGKYVYDEKVSNVFGAIGTKAKVAISAFLISLVVWTVLGNPVGATEKFLPKVSETISGLVSSVKGNDISAQQEKLLVDSGEEAKVEAGKLEKELPSLKGVPEEDTKIKVLKSGKTGLTPDQEKVIDEEISKHEAIKDNLQKETKLKIKSYKTRGKIYDSIKKISKLDKKEVAKVIEKDMAQKIFNVVSEKINKGFEENEKNILELETGKRASNLKDPLRDIKADPAKAKQVIKKLQKSNKIMAEYSKAIENFDSDDSDTYIGLGLTHRQLQLCAVINSFDKFELDGETVEMFPIDCTNLVDSNGNLLKLDSLEKSIEVNPQLEAMFLKKINDFEAIGLINLSKTLKKAFSGKELTDAEYKSVKEQINKEITAKSDMLSKKYSPEEIDNLLDFWNTVYAVASDSIDSFKNQPSKTKDKKYEDKLSDSEFRLKEIHNYFASSTDLWKSYNSNKNDEELAKFFNLGKGVNSSQNKILPNEIPRAKTKYLNKGQVQIAENSVRKWDSLLSVIEENYFKS
jgi:hypothetical protein